MAIPIQFIPDLPSSKIIGGVTGNANITVVSSEADVYDALNADKILEFQTNITLTANRVLPNNVTLKWGGGSLILNGFTLTGVNSKIDAPINELLIDAFTGNIDGTWESPIISAKNIGLKADFNEVYDVSITTATNIATSATANFTANDVGKTISINGALVGYATEQLNGGVTILDKNSVGTLTTTITGFTNSTTVTLADNATRTVSGVLCRYGSDNHNAGLNLLHIRNSSSGKVIFNEGQYFKHNNDIINDVDKSRWLLGNGTDDIVVEASGCEIISIPNNCHFSESFRILDTKRLRWNGGLIKGEFDMHNWSGDALVDEGVYSIAITSLSMNTKITNLDIINFTGDGLKNSSDFQFTNYIKGSAAAGYPGVAEFVMGTVDDGTGVVTADVNADFAYTDNLIDVSTAVFEETRKISPTRKGLRQYQFSGSSFAGWSGLTSDRFWVYYYDDASAYLYKSSVSEFYRIYQFSDEVKYIRIVIDRPLDLTTIDAQVRAPLNPVGLVLDNVNISDCGRHGASNLPNKTSWSNSTIKRIGATLPAYGINCEDDRRSARDYTFTNLTFEDCYNGDINLVGTINVIIDGVKHEGNTRPGWYANGTNVITAQAIDRGRNVISTNNIIRNGKIVLDRADKFINNTVFDNVTTATANGCYINNNNYYNHKITNEAADNFDRVPNQFKNNTMRFDKIWNDGVFKDPNNTLEIENLDIIFNDISRLNSLVTGVDVLPTTIELSTSNKLWSTALSRTTDLGGYIKNLSIKGIRNPLATRDISSNCTIPMFNIDTLYCEPSIYFLFGAGIDRVIKNVTTDGWVSFPLFNYEATIISPTPTITLENLKSTIPIGEFNWTNTASALLTTGAKNASFYLYKPLFDLQVSCSSTAGSNKYFKWNHLGTTTMIEPEFKSVSNINIDFTNTTAFSASTGDILIVDPFFDSSVFTFTLRTNDHIVFTKANPLMAIYATFADETAATTAGYPSGYMYMTATGEFRIKL